jgi:hypothetical protein
MFHQFIGDGANIFIAIVATIVGFVAALGYTDYIKTKREEQQD